MHSECEFYSSSQVINLEIIQDLVHSLLEMDSSVLDDWLLAEVIEIELAESFGWDFNNIFSVGQTGCEFWLDECFPFISHDSLLPSVTQMVPS